MKSIEEQWFGLGASSILVADLDRQPIDLKDQSGRFDKTCWASWKNGVLGLTCFTSLTPPPAEGFNLPANRCDWSFGILGRKRLNKNDDIGELGDEQYHNCG